MNHIKEIRKYVDRFEQVVKELKCVNPRNALSEQQIKEIDFRDKRDINFKDYYFRQAMFTIYTLGQNTIEDTIRNENKNNKKDIKKFEVNDNIRQYGEKIHNKIKNPKAPLNTKIIVPKSNYPMNVNSDIISLAHPIFTMKMFMEQ